MYKKLTIMIFAILFMTISVINVFKPDVVFSEQENRYLQTFPKLSWNEFVSGELGVKIEKYSSDQFIYRDQWISMNTMIELGMGKKDNGRVYFGKDQWLYSLNDEFDDVQYRKNIDFLNEFYAKYSDTSNLSLMMIPSKYSIINQYAPKNAPFLNEFELRDRILTDIKGDMNVPDLFDALAKKSDADIYFRTDHHWTSLGSYYAYLEMMGDKAISLDEYTLEKVSTTFYGTDYRKSNAPFIKSEDMNVYLNETIKNATISVEGVEGTSPMLDYKALDKQDKYSFYQGGNQGFAQVKGKLNDGSSIMIIKDSFANSLIPYLLPNYDRIDFIDLRHYKGSVSKVIEQGNYDDIWFLYNIQTLVQDKFISKLGS